MNRPSLRICRSRGVAIVVVSGTVVSLTALTGGMIPASAQPYTTVPVYPTEAPVYTPTQQVPVYTPPAPVYTPTQEVPAYTPQAPVYTPTQQVPVYTPPAPVYTPTQQAPVVTEPPVVTTQAQVPVVTTQPPVVTTQAPVVTTQAPVVTTQAPVVTTQAPVVTTQAPVVTTTAAPAVTTTGAPAVTTTKAPAVTTTGAAVTTTAAPAVTTTGAAVTTTAGPALTTTGVAVTTTAGPALTTTGVGVTTTAGPALTTTGVGLTTSGSPVLTTVGLPGSSLSAGPSVTGIGGTTAGGTTSGGTVPVGSPGGSPIPTTSVQLVKGIPLEQPKVLEATPQNLEQAKAAVPIVVPQPPPAPVNQITEIKNVLNQQINVIMPPPNLPANGTPRSLTSAVRQWQPQWVQYDEYYRPIIFNPFPDPLQIVYNVAGIARVLTINPLASIVTEVAALGAYNFTAMVLNAVGIPTSIAVGNFFGGGYYPGPGQPPPPPPPPVQSFQDVPVQVKYTNATYEPFVVKKIIDVGMDPAVGEQKVLLDGVTPAWGQWQTTSNGERTFEVHKTQQFPGVDAPAQGPLPGDYPLQLVSAQSPTGLSTRDVVLIGAGVVVLLLGLGAVVLTMVLGRRRRAH
jgi:hypothetical protein